MPKSRVKKRPDGRYQMQIYLGTEDGKRKYKYFYGSTAKEVEKKVKDALERLGKGIDISATETFSTWCRRYLRIKQATVTAANFKNYPAKVTLLEEYLGPRPVDKIRAIDLQEILFDLAARNPHTGKPTAKKTLVDYRSVMREIFQLMVDNRVIENNPALSLKVSRDAPKETRRALTEEEQRWIVETPHRAQTAAMVMMYAGLRRGELIPLTWADVDLSAHTITVCKAVEAVGGKFKVKPVTKSVAGMRTVMIPNVLVNYLAAQKRTSIYVCPNTTGGMMSDTSWRRMWDSYLTDLNFKYGDFVRKPTSKFAPEKLPFVIPRITPHWLRHTFCSMMYMAGVDVVTAQNQMGHADIKTTLHIYTHLSERFKAAEMEKLNTYLNADACQMPVMISK